jgi:hypothetical protein
MRYESVQSQMILSIHCQTMRFEKSGSRHDSDLLWFLRVCMLQPPSKFKWYQRFTVLAGNFKVFEIYSCIYQMARKKIVTQQRLGECVYWVQPCRPLLLLSCVLQEWHSQKPKRQICVSAYFKGGLFGVKFWESKSGRKTACLCLVEAGRLA